MTLARVYYAVAVTCSPTATLACDVLCPLGQDQLWLALDQYYQFGFFLPLAPASVLSSNDHLSSHGKKLKLMVSPLGRNQSFTSPILAKRSYYAPPVVVPEVW